MKKLGELKKEKGKVLLDYKAYEIEKGVLVKFRRYFKWHIIEIVQVEKGHTQMDDYYKYKNKLTASQFDELHYFINGAEAMVGCKNYSK